MTWVLNFSLPGDVFATCAAPAALRRQDRMSRNQGRASKIHPIEKQTGPNYTRRRGENEY